MQTNIINNLPLVTKRPELWREVFIAVVGPAATVLLTLLMPGWLGLQPKVAADNRNGGTNQAAQESTHDGLAKGGADRRIEGDGEAPQLIADNLPHEVGGLSLAELNRARLNGRWVKHEDGSYGWVEHLLILTVNTPQRTWIAEGPTRWKGK